MSFEDGDGPPPARDLAPGTHRLVLRGAIASLVRARRHEQLFEQIEQRGLLIKQADGLGAFTAAGEGLEVHALPALVERGDWSRFLRYSLLALNLRHLAESLAEPVILAALARSGREKLALDVADRIADPLRRAVARAQLADAFREVSPSAFRGLVPDLQSGLEEDVPPPLDPAEVEGYAAGLAGIARSLGSDFSLSQWSGWIQRLVPSPPAALQVRTAVAEAYLAHSDPDHEDLWQALAAVGDPGTLLRIIPAHLGSRPLRDLDAVLERLAGLLAPETAFRAGVRLLDGQAGLDPDSALEAWDRWSARRLIPWSLDLMEDGRRLFGLLDRECRQAVLAGLADRPETQVALRVAALEVAPDAAPAGEIEETLAAVDRLPDGASRLRWSLRYLRARPAEPAAEVRSQVDAVFAQVAESRYAVPPEDLRLCLDLVADFLPQPLGPVLDDVASSPATRAEALRRLAAEGSAPVVASLLEQAERCAALVSANEAEGFRFRGELIRLCIARLCLLGGDTAALDAAAERLLPGEEDELRSSLAEALAAAGRRPAAEEVCARIRERRRKFLTRLRIVPAEDLEPEALSANALYRAVAVVEPIEAERLGLTALLLPPVDLQDRVRTLLGPIQDGDAQALFLLRLAWHSLAFERVHLDRYRDPVAPLEMVRHGLSPATDASLAALLPEIVHLGATAGLKAAKAELEEAFWRLAALEGLPWTVKREALDDLLACLRPAVLDRQDASPRRRVRAAAEALAFLARLPARMEEGAARTAVREHWPEILPLLVAAADRLSGSLPTTLTRSLAEGIEASRAAAQARSGPVGAVLLALCQMPGEGRAAAASRILKEPGPDPALAEVIEGLCHLLACGSPERVPALLARLPPERRDPLGVRLLRNGWLPGEAAEAVPPLLVDPAAQAQAAVWAGLSSGGGTEAGWTALEQAIQEGSFDPSSPACEPLVRRLWSADPQVSWPALARAAIRAVQSGGKLQGERALRLWLHAYLRPCPGEAGDPSPSQTAREAIERALSLKDEAP